MKVIDAFNHTRWLILSLDWMLTIDRYLLHSIFGYFLWYFFSIDCYFRKYQLLLGSVRIILVFFSILLFLLLIVCSFEWFYLDLTLYFAKLVIFRSQIGHFDRYTCLNDHILMLAFFIGDFIDSFIDLICYHFSNHTGNDFVFILLLCNGNLLGYSVNQSFNTFIGLLLQHLVLLGLTFFFLINYFF